MSTEQAQFSETLDLIAKGDIAAARNRFSTCRNLEPLGLTNFYYIDAIISFSEGNIYKTIDLLIKELKFHRYNTGARHTLAELIHNMDLGVPRPNDRPDLLTHVPKGGISCEIGCLHGWFSKEILKVVEPKHHTMIDPYCFRNRNDATEAEQDVQDVRFIDTYKFLMKEIREHKVELIRSRAEMCWDLFDNESLDFLYIDGDHTHEAVQHDLSFAKAKVKSGGLIGIDDYDEWWDGVFDTVNELVFSEDSWVSIVAISKVGENGQNILLRKK